VKSSGADFFTAPSFTRLSNPWFTSVLESTSSEYVQNTCMYRCVRLPAKSHFLSGSPVLENGVDMLCYLTLKRLL